MLLPCHRAIPYLPHHDDVTLEQMLARRVRSDARTASVVALASTRMDRDGGRGLFVPIGGRETVRTGNVMTRVPVTQAAARFCPSCRSCLDLGFRHVEYSSLFAIHHDLLSPLIPDYLRPRRTTRGERGSRTCETTWATRTIPSPKRVPHPSINAP